MIARPSSSLSRHVHECLGSSAHPIYLAAHVCCAHFARKLLLKMWQSCLLVGFQVYVSDSAVLMSKICIDSLRIVCIWQMYITAWGLS